MGIAERRQRQRDEVKCAIVNTAWQMVKKDGWDSLSMRRIADAIEYSAPVIYDHFANKKALLLEFSKKGFQLLFDKIIEAKGQHSDPADQIKAMADAYWNFAINNPEYYQLMFGIGMACCEMSKAIPEQEKYRELMMEPIEALKEKKNRQDISSCLKYHTLGSVLHGLISIRMVNNSPELNKLVLDDAVACFIKSFD